MIDTSNVEQRRTEDTPASRLSGANVKLMIGAIVAALFITVAVFVLVRHFRGRSMPVVTPLPAAEQTETAMDAAEHASRSQVRATVAARDEEAAPQ